MEDRAIKTVSSTDCETRSLSLCFRIKEDARRVGLEAEEAKLASQDQGDMVVDSVERLQNKTQWLIVVRRKEIQQNNPPTSVYILYIILHTKLSTV